MDEGEGESESEVDGVKIRKSKWTQPKLDFEPNDDKS